MGHHVADELAFQLPDEWSVTTVVSPPPSKDDAFASNLVVTRDRLRPNETMQTYIDRQLVDLAKRLKRFVLRGRRDVMVGGLPAHEISCSWQGNQGPIEQRLTVVPRGETRVVTFTASAAKNRAEAVLPVFEDVLKTLSFRVDVSETGRGEADDPPGV
jgi:hypothetical protein